LFTEIELALFVAFINGVPEGKVKEKGTREEKKETLNFYSAVNCSFGTARRYRYQN
jgi:hypothetical protein